MNLPSAVVSLTLLNLSSVFAQSSYDLPSRDPAFRSIRERLAKSPQEKGIDLDRLTTSLVEANQKMSEVLSREADLKNPDWKAIEAAVEPAAVAWQDLNKAFERLSEYNQTENIVNIVFVSSAAAAPLFVVAGVSRIKHVFGTAVGQINRPLVGASILAMGVASVSYAINELSVRPAKREFALRLATEFAESKKLLENLCTIYELTKSNGGEFEASLNAFVTEACQETSSLKVKFGLADNTAE